MAQNDESERYRKATLLALDQLDWCIEYLRTIRKTRISREIAKSRSAIAERVARQERDRRART